MNILHVWSLLEGLWGTTLLSALTFLFGGALGFLLALTRISPSQPTRQFASLYIQLVQGIPVIVLMGLAFYGPSLVGWRSMAPLAAATLAMTLYASAYLGEIWRGCLEAVAPSQWEAAECLGLSRWQRMRMVILPQAIRMAIPPTVGFLVQVVKNSSVASLVIGYTELSYNAKILNNATFEPFLYFGLAGFLYFAICYPLSRLALTAERRLLVAHR